MSDTTLSAARMQLAAQRRLTGEQRLALAFGMSRLARQLLLTRLGHEHPRLVASPARTRGGAGATPDLSLWANGRDGGRERFCAGGLAIEDRRGVVNARITAGQRLPARILCE